MPLRLSHPVIRSASAMPCSSSYSASARFHSLRQDLMMIFCTCAAGGKRAWACRRGRHGLTVCYSGGGGGGGGGGGRARRALLEGDRARHLLLEAGHLVEDRLRLVQHALVDERRVRRTQVTRQRHLNQVADRLCMSCASNVRVMSV